MGDSACLVHAFSYTSGIPSEAKQGNHMLALGESISFGRFMSESLAWEKWSTFSSHNRYVEEAERYAQPGSVAQKKAFFEAHYKRIAAAKKAAALLEQQANNNASDVSQAQSGLTDDHNSSTSDSQHMTFTSGPSTMEQAEVKADEKLKPDEHNSNIQSLEVVSDKTGATRVDMEPEVPVETPLKKDASNTTENENAESQYTFSGSELSGTPLIEKPLLKNFGSNEDVPSVKSKKKSAFSSFKSSVYRKTSKVPFSPAKPTTPHIKKENQNNATPITKKCTLDFTDGKRSTPKSLRSYISYTPAKDPDKLFAPANRKKENSRVAPNSYKAPQDCTTPLRTPNTATSARMSKHASATPLPENTRTKSPIDESKTTGPKWHILSAVCSKPFTACRNKLQSPTVSTPFMLRTEERATRRKQKLEEKFNSKDVQKVQLQTKLKEKAESELRKLRQSFCFKARPLPDFYKERETARNQTKRAQ